MRQESSELPANESRRSSTRNVNIKVIGFETNKCTLIINGRERTHDLIKLGTMRIDSKHSNQPEFLFSENVECVRVCSVTWIAVYDS